MSHTLLERIARSLDRLASEVSEIKERMKPKDDVGSHDGLWHFNTTFVNRKGEEVKPKPEHAKVGDIVTVLGNAKMKVVRVEHGYVWADVNGFGYQIPHNLYTVVSHTTPSHMNAPEHAKVGDVIKINGGYSIDFVPDHQMRQKENGTIIIGNDLKHPLRRFHRTPHLRHHSHPNLLRVRHSTPERR